MDMSWNIVFNTDGKKYRLRLVSSIEIVESVDSLADTATIMLPETVMNVPLNIENRIKRGSEVLIELGYNNNLKEEFKGYIQDIQQNDGALKIVCEDELFKFRVKVENKSYKVTKISKVLQDIINQIDPSITLSCDYDFTYEKYTIYQATGFDILLKIADETRANIYFKGKTLHMHPPYKEIGGRVIYDETKNIEKSSLELKKAIDRKFEITIESVGSDGKIKTAKSGVTGGDSSTIKVVGLSQEEIQKIADSELIKRSADALTGSITTWLIPFVKPTFTAVYRNPDYPYKSGQYYVDKVTTTLSDGGGVRVVNFGIKLS